MKLLYLITLTKPKRLVLKSITRISHPILAEEYPWKVGDIVNVDEPYGLCQISSIEKPIKNVNDIWIKPRIFSVNGQKLLLKTKTVKYYSLADKKTQANVVKLPNSSNKMNDTFKKNGMFSTIVEMYKSTLIPTKEANIRVSYGGTLAFPNGETFVSIETDSTLKSYPKELTVEVPCYSIQRPVAQVTVGDIVKLKTTFGKVLEKRTDGSLEILTVNGTRSIKHPIADALVGQPMVRVITNFFSFGQGFNPWIFAFAEGEKFDAKALMMLSMSGQANGIFSNMNAMGLNPMMFLLFDESAEEGSSSEIMKMMLLSQLMQTNQGAQTQVGMGNFPFSNLFGAQPIAPQQTQVQSNQPIAAQAPTEQPSPISTDALVEQILSNDDAIAKLKQKLGL